ncbi:hypothetical protein [Fulvivirga sp.]|uniref:hypothetical protein n=1 Tax=Fulvivirga sp. TaxID=1931237 RepID=UPI0032EDFC71
MDWTDFNIGIVVNSPQGKGIVQSVDKLNDKIQLTILTTGKLEAYKLSELSMETGQIKLTFSNQIGQFILLFQRLENRLKDFVNYTLNLNINQSRLLTSDFTAGRLKSKVDWLFKNYAKEDNIKKWKGIGLRIDKLRDIRNTLIHGYLFHFNELFELDMNSLYFKNSNGKSEVLDYKKLNVLIEECITAYYLTHELFMQIAEPIKAEISKKKK